MIFMALSMFVSLFNDLNFWLLSSLFNILFLYLFNEVCISDHYLLFEDNIERLCSEEKVK